MNAILLGHDRGSRNGGVSISKPPSRARWSHACEGVTLLEIIGNLLELQLPHECIFKSTKYAYKGNFAFLNHKISSQNSGAIPAHKMHELTS